MSASGRTYEAEIIPGGFPPDSPTQMRVQEFQDGKWTRTLLATQVPWEERLIDEDDIAHCANVEFVPSLKAAEAILRRHELEASGDWTATRVPGIRTPYAYSVTVQARAQVADALAGLHAAVKKHASMSEAATERDEAVRTALSADLPVAETAAITGLSRERVYQIRDGRR